MLKTVRILLILGLSLGFRVQAQEIAEKYLEVRGISELEMEPLARATANLYDGSTKVKSIQTGADGRFSFKLDFNKQYTIEIEKDGLISKRISFNTQMPDEEKGTWMNEFSIGLIKPCGGIDYSVLKEPVDRVSFDAKRREYISDKNYVNTMRPRIESLMIKTDQCQLDTYESLVKKGDQAAVQKNYEEAKKLYNEALEIYPREEYPSKRIAEINTNISKQQNSAEAFKKLITEADALATQGDMKQALQKYKEAGSLNPQDNYPKQKAAEIESKLVQQESAKKALLTKEENYNQAMAKASVAYTRKDYATARQYYQEASQIKPEESLPKTRVLEIETIQAKKAADDAARASEIARRDALEKEYQGLVAQADEQFKAKKFDEAKATYAKAMTLKPSESYPSQRVKAIENAVASEQAAIQKSKDDSYNSAMAAGDNALSHNQFQIAKDAYQKALTIRPDDLSAKSNLARAVEQEKDFTRQKALDDQYKQTVKTADAFYSGKDLPKARETYAQALQLKPGDQYAQSRITAIDNSVAAEQAARLKTTEEGYKSAIGAANTAIAKQDYTQAKVYIEKAISIKPDDLYAKTRLTEVLNMEREITQKKALEEKYNQIIKTGDALLAGKDLTKARETYMQAMLVKPADPYATAKITSIDNSIAVEQAAKLKATEEGYKAAVGAANTAIAQKAYTQAKEYLQKALSIKPGDAYASGKTAEVERLIMEQQKKSEEEKLLAQRYNEAISSADKLFNAQDYQKAKTEYARALQMKPGDSYSNQKIVAIQEILAAEAENKIKQAEDAYSKAMASGSNALTAKDFKSAKEYFQQALTIKSNDQNAKLKLSETELLIRQEQDRILAEQNRKKKYDETITSADQLLAQKNFSGAKAGYEMALDLMPSETYPKQKLIEVLAVIDQQEKALTEAKARESAYNISLANADKYFKARDYIQAKDEYARALAIKPNESFPKARMAEMEELIARRIKEQADAKSKAEAYTAAINAGNEAFGKKDFVNARNFYNEALKQMPGDLLSIDQIKKIDYLLAEAEKVKKAEQARKTAVENLIASADKSFDGAQYVLAKEDYKKALVIEPSNAYAKQRIAKIDEINRLLSQNPAKTNNQGPVTASKNIAAIPMGELSFRNESERQLYLDELKSKYPQGITLEKYKDKYKETYRYIVIREKTAQEFRYIKYLNYNGDQYSVNGKPITQQYFVSQTKTRDGENFKEIDM